MYVCVLIGSFPELELANWATLEPQGSPCLASPVLALLCVSPHQAVCIGAGSLNSGPYVCIALY